MSLNFSAHCHAGSELNVSVAHLAQTPPPPPPGGRGPCNSAFKILGIHLLISKTGIFLNIVATSIFPPCYPELNHLLADKARSHVNIVLRAPGL